ncbi:ChrR family anti-sigma-E factor [Cognatiyoonia koreensis]|nr:ChrR family anti-sigma-E factor [Cognatiyoonia koreensis]
MTKNIKHHLTNDLLMGYSAGTLPEAFNVVVASHISMCDTCRAALAEYDAVGGEVMMKTDAVEMAENSLAATMALISDAPAEEPLNSLAVKSGVFPSPLRDYVSGDIDAVKWRKVGGGVSQMILKTSDRATVRLLKIPAGAAMPDHGHNGTELTLVLQGAFADDDDYFAAGDIEVANEDLVHTPVAAEGVDCICLAATDAPLQFNSLLPRIAQKFMRI